MTKKQTAAKKSGRGGKRVRREGRRLGRPRKFAALVKNAGPVETRAVSLPPEAWAIVESQLGGQDLSTWVLAKAKGE